LADGKSSAKDKILAAADHLAREVGPGHISLDAVAQRAGVSKGGLLYHFPTKAKLLEALVEYHLKTFDEGMKEREALKGDVPNNVVSAYVDLFMREHERKQPPPSGLMAALAENPNLLDPVRRFNRIFLDRIKNNAVDPTLATIIFLAIEGIRSMELFNIKALGEEEFEAVLSRLKELAKPA